jgi:hypothetical protein
MRMTSNIAYKEINEKVRRIKERIGEFAEAIVGSVSDSDAVSVSDESTRIAVLIPFKDYMRNKIKIGSYLGVASIVHEMIILGKVVEIRRYHAAGSNNTMPPLEPSNDYTGIANTTKVVLELLTECPMDGFENCEPNTVHTPIDPLSIVFKPRREVLMRMLQLPSEGVLVGKLYSGGEVVEDVDIRLPVHSLYEHVLIVGTTGSGKTVLLKNLALTLLNEVRDSVVIALDLQGDYPHLTMPNPSTPNPVLKPIDSITVIEPITRDYLKSHGKLIDEYADEYLGTFLNGNKATIEDVGGSRTLAESLGYALLRLFLDNTYSKKGVVIEDVGFNITLDQDGKSAVLHEVNAKVRINDREFNIRFVPWSLKFSEVYKALPMFFPVFSYKVSRLFSSVLRKAMKDCGVKELGSLINKQLVVKRGNKQEIQNCIEKAALDSRLAKQQIENLIRGLTMLHEFKIFDVKYNATNEEYDPVINTALVNNITIKFREPNYQDLLSGFVVLDLRLFMENPTAASIVAYRILSKAFSINDKVRRAGGTPKPTFILIDEAHNYFPQTGSVSDFDKETVEDMINKITRLGRSRNIGVIFATHTPEDLNDQIIQLTNTKIALRSVERKVLEKVGLENYAEELAYAADGVAVLSNYIFRTYTMMVKTLPPQTMHRSHK